ncbi:MAG: alginate O-acetyltransferase complex protein AlgI [Flavobacteriales bacterium]|jgi:alginate O-acetyltransferase complex protein AlgI
MVFNSPSFLIFFLLFFTAYWTIFKSSTNRQNTLLLIGSYVFYGWADWRLLSYLVAASLFNYGIGEALESSKKEKTKKWLVYLAVLQGVGGLIYFKYNNFFIEGLMYLIGDFNTQLINILAPLGISFFTFKTLGYVLSINKGKIEAEKNVVVFLNYVSFFPCIMSGPIDSAKSFIPQLKRVRTFDYKNGVNALRQILWGLFKKVAVADSIATVTDSIFLDYSVLPGSSMLLGAFLYTVQIYADFSGYSDMAIGFSRLLGFNTTKNFEFPFFANNIADFWRRWHISLTSWLTEFLFTPLSILFRDYGRIGLALAIVINFTVIGIWHGPRWTYLCFGFAHGCYFIPLIVKGTMNKKNKMSKQKYLPGWIEARKMLGTFVFVMLTFILFRAESISIAFEYYRILFSSSLFQMPFLLEADTGLHVLPKVFSLPVFAFLLIEWFGRDGEYAIANIGKRAGRPARRALYYSLLVAIFWFGGKEQTFIYFQF